MRIVAGTAGTPAEPSSNSVRNQNRQILRIVVAKLNQKKRKYQPSGKGGTRSLPATPHHLQNPKWPPGGPKLPMGSGKVSTPRFLGAPINFHIST